MNNERQELREAVEAADRALTSLNAARECLQSAGNWGIVDILGGGMFSTFMKHNKMERAQQELANAKSAVQRFAKELSDLDGAIDMNLQSADFLTFADYFFDGMVADWMMQKRISDAKGQVNEAISRISQIRSRLAQF